MIGALLIIFILYWAIRIFAPGRSNNSITSNGQNRKRDSSYYVRIFIFGIIVLSILMIVWGAFNNPSTESASNQPDYLGAAEEKMDNGIPLNDQETKAVNDAIGVNQQSDDIEKKHGE